MERPIYTSCKWEIGWMGWDVEKNLSARIYSHWVTEEER
jgi:hypothetical protein